MTAARRGARLADPTVIGCVLSLLLAVMVVAYARWGPDWPAQEFRVWIAVHDGLSAWTSRWYGGTSLPGYSILYPPLGAALGAGPVGVLSAVTATWAVTSSMAPNTPTRAAVFAVAVATAVVQNLLIGQVPYLLGIAFAAVALRALLRPQSAHTLWFVGAASLCCALASPLAGASLLLVLPPFLMLVGRRALALTPAAVGIGVCTVLGGAGGFFPFDAKSLFGFLAFCAGAFVFGRPLPRPLQVFLVGYCLVALVFFFVPSAVGGNIVRLGKLIAIPLTVRFVPAGRTLARRLLAGALTAAAAVWPSLAFESSITNGAHDPSQRPAYYSALLGFLHTQNPLQGRLEIPFTREHWEAMWVATAYPIARGWERQTDLAHNAVLYHRLTASSYRRWLDDNAVDLVALPSVATDYGGKAEAALLRHPPAYLVPAWSDAHWRVWRVAHATPLTTGHAARLTAIRGDEVDLHFDRPGATVVHIHADRLWQVESGSASLGSNDTGWLHVRATRAGEVRLRAGVL